MKKNRQTLKKYSYADTKNRAMRRFKVVLLIFILIAVYVVLTTSIFSTKVMESASMQPDLRPGDRFIFSVFGFNHIVYDLTRLNTLPMRRGNIVLVNLHDDTRSLPIRAADSLIRFFTLGKRGLGDRSGAFSGRLSDYLRGGSELFIKRVLALPGDEISMTNYVLRVKPADEPYTFTEFEVSVRPYNINIPPSLALWDESIPFSGSFDKNTLGADQCFVLSDARANTNDSRTWGTIAIDKIAGKALFRYWPLNRMGIP
jgi:signal peptidase I